MSDFFRCPGRRMNAWINDPAKAVKWFWLALPERINARTWVPSDFFHLIADAIFH